MVITLVSRVHAVMSRGLDLLIVAYQKTISPDHGLFKSRYPYGFCKYHPSCSQYTRIALQKHGIVVGIAKGFWRILRCNPWSKGGIDMP